jgi:hypothetical protein
MEGETDQDRIYRMNRSGHRVSILIILFILSKVLDSIEW